MTTYHDIGNRLAAGHCTAAGHCFAAGQNIALISKNADKAPRTVRRWLRKTSRSMRSRTRRDAGPNDWRRAIRETRLHHVG